MKRQLLKSVIVLVCVFLVLSCEDKNGSGDASRVTQKVNEFIMDYMTDSYLWNDRISTNIDIKKETDPFALLDKLIYTNLDKWTFLTDDAEALIKEYEGVSTTYGYNLNLYKFNNVESFFGVVRFVYPGSPAERAGVARGDIIIMINGNDITEANYLDLFYSSTTTLRMGVVNEEGNSIDLGTKTVSMQAVEMYLDPVNTYKIIDKGDKKIGYLCYTGYRDEARNKLLEVFRLFKNSHVTDVVLDLRYNLGGTASSTIFLSSVLVPESAARGEDVFLRELWNNDYMDYYRQEGTDLNLYFDKEVEVNMDLDHLYVLTSANTASAPEATMAGLMPYLNVIQVGEPTHGKYCGAALISPWIDNKGNVDKEIENWALSMVIYKYANKNGLTDFKNGLTPTYDVEDDWSSRYPLGDERDPILAKAIEVITGIPVQFTRSSVPVPGKRLPAQMQPDFRRSGLITDYK